LKRDLSEKKNKIDSELSFLPKSFADNPQGHLLNLCSAFVQEIENYTSGQASQNLEEKVFLQDGRPHYESLKKKINLTKPQFAIVPSPPVILEMPMPPSLDQVVLPEQDKSSGNYSA
jgi:hypothetical protein